MTNKTCGECKYYKPYNEKICLYVHRSCVSPKTKACNNFAKPTVFDRITASLEVLAEKLVYQRNSKVIHQNDKCTIEYWTHSWKSSVIKGQSFETKEEALAATVEKLKEVEK